MATSTKKKVLLMGKSKSGKTSMRSIIFANYVPRETTKLVPTLDVEHNNVRFIGGLLLNLWDCGGQDTFYDNYFHSQQESIFSNVQLLIYVFDISSNEPEQDLEFYKETIANLITYSPNASVFVLLHKMDRIRPEIRNDLFKERETVINQESKTLNVKCFGTSIWDETLYLAWSAMVNSLIPNKAEIEKLLKNFGETTEADEVVLFEKATFLSVATVEFRKHEDNLRHEKISNIIKQFKLCCADSQTQFRGMEIRNRIFAAYITLLTPGTYLMVITSKDTVNPAVVNSNIIAARQQFLKYKYLNM